MHELTRENWNHATRKILKIWTSSKTYISFVLEQESGFLTEHRNKVFFLSFRQVISNCFPKLSRIHHYTCVVKLQNYDALSFNSIWFCAQQKHKLRPTGRLFSRSFKQKLKKRSALIDITNCVSQRVKYYELLLSGDIETNPGPSNFVNPLNTIAAPYSQSNTEIFGVRNAGRQCVAMSFIALIYNFRKSVSTSTDLVHIMDIGNQLYTSLSESTSETFLLLSDLPAMVNLFETNYELRFSESYSGILNGQFLRIGDYQFVTTLDAAFESLVRENYSNFILTVGSYAVAIYCLDSGVFKVFDSHSKDLFGQTHRLGTCTVIIEIDSLNKLVQYFKDFHAQTSSVYELRKMNIFENRHE